MVVTGIKGAKGTKKQKVQKSKRYKKAKGTKKQKVQKSKRGKRARGRLPINRSCYLYYKKYILQEDGWRSGTEWSGSPSL